MDNVARFITKFKAGDIVYQRGSKQENLYIINRGKVQLKIDNNLSLITLSKGDYFGEESLNPGQLATSTAEVIEDSDIIVLPYPILTEMMSKTPDISLKILKKLSEKHSQIIGSLMAIFATMVKKAVTPQFEPSDQEKESLLPESIKPLIIIKKSNRIVQLHKTINILGRRDHTTGYVPEIDLTDEDQEKFISRKHARISYINNKFYLSEEPLAVNGTFLNGNKLDNGVKYEIKNGDEFTICHLNIVFKV